MSEPTVTGMVDAVTRGQSGLLIVLDIDGTILLEDESLSPGVVEAVSLAVKAGNRVMLATGRSWEATRGYLRVLGIAPEYVVCSNGAVLMRAVRPHELVYERYVVETFDPAPVLNLLHNNLADARYLVELADGTRLYTEPMDDWTLAQARRVPFEELLAQDVCRIVVVEPGSSDTDFMGLAERIGLSGVSYSVGWTAWMDIAPDGVDKGTALERVRTELDVAGHDVIVVGDGRNDLGMFAWALDIGGRAVAMGQGIPEVHAAAGEITLSAHAGGVAALLNAL